MGIYPEEIEAWMASAQRVVDESHPCDAARFLQQAINMVSDLAAEREMARTTVSKMLADKLTGIAAAGKDALLRPDLVLDAIPPGKKRNGRVWRRSPDEHSLAGVTAVRDDEGDLWRPVDPNNPAGKWVYGDNDGNAGSFAELLDEYSFLVEVGDDVIPQGWFEVDGVTKEPPLPVKNVSDGETTWTRIASEKWRRSDWDDDYVKEFGYFSFAEVLDEVGAVVRVDGGPIHRPVVFHEGDDEPPENLSDYVKDQNAFYWQRTKDGWTCPGTNGVSHMEEKFGDDVDSVSWDELLAEARVLTEYHRG